MDHSGLGVQCCDFSRVLGKQTGYEIIILGDQDLKKQRGDDYNTLIDVPIEEVDHEEHS